MEGLRFIVLESNKKEYLGYIHDNEYYGYLKFSKTLPLSTPYTKFELVSTDEDYVVHIKSCRNNKYLKRVKNDSIAGNQGEEHYWIAATANEPVCDKTQESCTVFKLIPADLTTDKIIRIMHLQSGCYLRLFSRDSSNFNHCVMANHADPDGDSRDIFTVIDCESLVRKAFASPKFIVIVPDVVGHKYMGFIREVGDCDDGRLQCSETAVSPYAKFEVEFVPQTGSPDDHSLVRIRSCQNNKYWAHDRSSIYVAAKKPAENDDSTLFKLESTDDGTDCVLIMHVGSRSYLSVSTASSRVLLHEVEGFNGDACRNFHIIDWESLLVLPPYVAFKGDNDKYLCLGQACGHPAMLFASSRLGNRNVLMKISMTKDGYVRIKPDSSNKYWQYSSELITVDADDTTLSDQYTLFLPLKVDDHTIALVCKGKNTICCMSENQERGNYHLTPHAKTINEGSLLRVEVPVLKTEFYDIEYNLDNSRIYEENPLLVTKNSASNYTQESETLNVRLSYADTKTSTWMANFSVKLGAKTSLDVGLPLIFDGKLELSSEIQLGAQFGKTETKTTTVELVHQVKVPPMTKVTVSMFATRGKCDVPFKITRKDTLLDGKIVISQVPGGTYTGSNNYSNYFVTKAESLVVSSSSCV